MAAGDFQGGRAAGVFARRIRFIQILAGILIVGCARPEAPPQAEKTIQTRSAATPAEKSPKSQQSVTTVVPETPGKSETTDAAAQIAKGALSESDLQRTKTLYNRNCGGCHGEQGDGQGLAARFLYPKPRNFRSGHFRLVSTTNGVPTSDDLVTVLKRGMPGSAMVPWPQLTDDDLKLLAAYVMELRRDALRKQERAMAKDGDYEVTDEEVEETVSKLTTPGSPIEAPTIPAATAESIARGKELYLKSCASCHGKEGKGDGQEKMVDTDGFPTRPRDLTQGVFKGSPDPVSVYRRTQAGMPGSPMPATKQITPEQITDMVHFVLSLSNEETREATVLKRQQIVAQHIAELPNTPAASAWGGIPAIRVRTTPLWWRDDFEPYLDVQVVHDGTSIALRLSWEDATYNDAAYLPEEFEDMVAAELYQGASEPFLGMGAADEIIDLWQWRAGTKSSRDPNALALLDDYPFDAPLYRELAKGNDLPDFVTARVGGNPLAMREHSAANMIAKGPGSVTFLPKPSQVVGATAEWKDGRWAVVLVRPLSVAKGEGLGLAPGGRCSIAFAVWDGEARDRAAQKRITLWNDLELK